MIPFSSIFRVRALLVLGCLGLFSSVAVGSELIPVPEFTNHDVPITRQSVPDSPMWEWLHVALLVIALSIASYMAIVSRSRKGLFVLAVASLLWFGFVRGGCICAIGAVQNVTLGMFDSSYAIPWTVIAIFVLPLVFTLFFGRTFCAAVCPLGAIQEVVAIRPVRVPSWLDHSLGLVPYIYLGLAILYAATGTAFIICRYDPFVAMFRMSGNINMLIFGGSILLLGVFIGRPYCRYLCPYGAILGVLSKGSKWHGRIAPETCIQCHLCENSCPYGAIATPTRPIPKTERVKARGRLAKSLLSVPVLILCGVLVGMLLGTPLSKLDTDVRLAERIIQEDAGEVEGMTDASEAFRNTGQSTSLLIEHAVDRRERFGWLGMVLGGWVGLVIGVKLVMLAVRRRRVDYEPDRARCVSCARCYWYCPGEHVRQGLVGDVSQLVSIETKGAPR